MEKTDISAVWPATVNVSSKARDDEDLVKEAWQNFSFLLLHWTLHVSSAKPLQIQSYVHSLVVLQLYRN